MSVRFSRLVASALLLALASCSSAPKDASSGLTVVEMTRLGDAMRARGDYGASMDYYRRAIALDAKDAAAVKGLGASLEQFGDKPAAMDLYKEGVKNAPKDAELRRAYGKLLLAYDQPAEAKVQYEAALDRDDDDAKARGGLAVALDYLGQHRNAQKEYEKLLRDDPRNLGTINNYAYSLILSHDYGAAIKRLEPEMGNPSASPAMRQNLALAYGLSGREDDAARILATDLPPAKVRESLNYYRIQRAEAKVTTTPYAELGSYATQAMAVAQIQKLRGQIDRSGGRLKAVVMPELNAPGGTPRFTVRMMGCGRPDEVTRLCDTLGKSGIPCVPRGKGGE